MTLKKKHKIKKISRSDRFEAAAKLIMESKFRIVKKQIKKYLKDDSVENLHSMRIAIRRMRYSLELFYNCFESKFYNNVYSYLRMMQDVVGELRDLDVLEEKIHSIDRKEHLSVPKSIYENINQEKNQIRSAIKIELIKFVKDKQVNQFITK